MRVLLKTHPEASKLVGPNPTSAFWVFAIVGLQIAVAIALRNQPLWVIIAASWLVGAFADHALWVMIHECTHNLVFRKPASNSLLQIFANLPIVFPSAISFRIYHLKHHQYQGDLDRDADLARPFEARLVGRSTFGKTLWFFLFFLSQAVRVSFLKGIKWMNGWVALNLLAEVVFLVALTHFFGWGALAYMAGSSIFAVGLHPVGGRWVQEHYTVSAPQETYSYYGPLNKIAFNVGYHNEHHDLMGVSWNNLPKLRALAPELYDTLYWHPSWSKLLFRFLTDPNLGLDSRVYRTHDKKPTKAAAAVAQKSKFELEDGLDPA
jgi:sphingolipid delta-4 desaturase